MLELELRVLLLQLRELLLELRVLLLQLRVLLLELRELLPQLLVFEDETVSCDRTLQLLVLEQETVSFVIIRRLQRHDLSFRRHAVRVAVRRFFEGL